MKRGKKKLNGGKVVVHLDQDMYEALESVRRQLSHLEGERVGVGVVIRRYLERGLTADKALPRPQSEKVESHA